MTKTVYAYAADGKYIGERTLDDTDRSPVSGAWQIPGNMTEVKPPKAKEGYDICYKGGKWTYTENLKEMEPTPDSDEITIEKPYVSEAEIVTAEALLEFDARISALETKNKRG